MIKICISGLTASGKTTLGNLLEKELGIRHIKSSYKSNVSNTEELIRFIKNIDAKYVKKFDNDIIEQSRNIDCIVSTWHGPWIIKDATIRVWLEVSEKERARRWSKAHNISIREATKIVRLKDKYTIKQFKLAYKKDRDMSIFDLYLNYEKVTQSEAVSIISMLALSRSKSKSMIDEI
ncbi:MAG: AAA family ATPase [Candidatus Micrarchaeia archaeon]